MSNYPQSYGSYQGYGGYGNFTIPQNMGYTSGPPPPPMGAYGNFGGYGGGGFSAYNNATGYGCPAVNHMSASYPMGNQPPPQPPQQPMSYSYQPHNVMQNQMEMAMQRQVYQQMGYKAPKVPSQEEESSGQEENEEEGGQQIDDDIKNKMKNIFIDELMRRYQVTSTFESVFGTVLPLVKYTEDDLVVKFHKAQENGMDITGEDWNPEYDLEYLRKAMKGFGTDEEVITCIVTTRSNAQRQRMKEMFKTMYGRDLIEDIKGETSGDYRKILVDSFMSPAEYDAKCIKRAIYGLGTDELALIEILMSRTNNQIKEMRSVYGRVARPNKVTSETLIDDDIKDDTSGDFKRLLISIAQGNRTVLTRKDVEDAVEEMINANGDGTGMFEVNYTKLTNVNRAKKDARALYEAGEKKWGTDEETFNRIFACRDFHQLKEIYHQYVKISQNHIHHAIASETSGNVFEGLKAIANCVMNRPKFFAERLYASMKGLGTDEETLMRIVISRSEIDMVQIKSEFLELAKKTLYNYIEHDTSYNFKKFLLAIVGRD